MLTFSNILLLSIGLGEKLVEKGIRVNCVAPGPVWTPIVVSSAPNERIVQAGIIVSIVEIIVFELWKKNLVLIGIHDLTVFVVQKVFQFF